MLLSITSQDKFIINQMNMSEMYSKYFNSYFSFGVMNSLLIGFANREHVTPKIPLPIIGKHDIILTATEITPNNIDDFSEFIMFSLL